MTTITYVLPDHLLPCSNDAAIMHFAPAICAMNLVVGHDIKISTRGGFRMERDEQAGNGRGSYAKDHLIIAELTFSDERRAKEFQQLQQDIDLGVARYHA